MTRPATIEDASSLAAISLEVWLNTYIRDGVNAFFADYALEQFTAARFKDILDQENENIWVSQNAVGIDGFLRMSSNSRAPVDIVSDLEIATLYVQPRHHGRFEKVGETHFRIGDRAYPNNILHFRLNRSVADNA